MNVFIVGGTGAIGTHAISALVSSGHTVTALARTPEKATLIQSLGATPSIGSIFDEDVLIRSMVHCDAVINLATAIPPSAKFASSSAWARKDRVRREGSKTLASAAQSAGVTRLIQESVSMLYKDGADTWIDEKHPVDHFPMSLGNHAAEASTHTFTKAGGVGVVLRFGWFYGPGASHSEEFLELARSTGICTMFGKPSTFVSSIYTLDAGSAVANALHVPAGVYNVVDNEPVRKTDYAEALGQAAGKCWIKLPGRLASLLGHRTTSLTRSLRVSNRCFREATGWSPQYPSVREGWQAMAREHAMRAG